MLKSLLAKDGHAVSMPLLRKLGQNMQAPNGRIPIYTGSIIDTGVPALRGAV